MKIISSKAFKSFIVISIIAISGAGSSVRAVCSNATLSGTYRYHWTGFGSFGAGGEQTVRPNGPFTPFAAVGLATFNGDGTSSNIDTVQIGGAVIQRNFTNTYSMGADCRGTVTVNGAPIPGPHAHLVAAPDGSEILFINAFEGVVISGIYKRQ